VSTPAVVHAYRAGAALARVLPEPVAAAAANGIGRAAARLSGDRRTVVERNLRRVVGPELRGRELRRMVDATFASYARYYVESFRLPGLAPAEVEAGLTVEGYEHLEEALDTGLGPVIALPHLGGWEWAAFWLAVVPKLRVSAVAEALEPQELFAWFTDLRRSLGMNVIPLGPGAAPEVVKAINRGDVVCLVCDRFLAGSAVEVEFFGERTLLPAGPATLALRTGAPVLPVGVYFRGRGHHAVVRPPVVAERQGRLRDDVARVTQAIATELEALIRVAPEQWHLMQPNWPSDYEALGRTMPDLRERGHAEGSDRPLTGGGGPSK
jgi:phosphatidylinositol dimannoside acyltransferase